jgi:formylglycine-generating enzyme required for sulfatase activity
MTIAAATLAMSFAAVPSGSFDYGDVHGEGFPDERPACRCDIGSFALGRTPVSAGQYREYLRDSALEDGASPQLHGPVWGTPGRSSEDLPAVHVSWQGAVAFCAWLSARLGAVARLPTEAEWQYAAAGPAGLRWALGNSFVRSDYVSNAAGPAPVGGRRASQFGLYDMTGNVFEWCADTYCVPPGSPEPLAELGGSRLVKGGAFILRDPAAMRNAKRFSCADASCLDCVGFRVLCEDPEIASAA